MKRVALITNHDDDVYCFRKELLEELYKHGNKIIISCPYGEKLDLLDFKFEHDDSVIDRRGINPFKDFKLLLHYLNFIKKYKPDIVLNYTIKPNVYASIACRLKHVEYINNITGLGSVLKKGKILQCLIYNLLKFALKDSKCVFFQNATNMKLVLEKKIINGNYKLIPGSGVNVNRYEVQPYPMDDKVIVFNYIGRVLSEKGVDDFIEAAKIIKEKGYNTEFNIIGFIEPTEKHYEEEFKELEKKNIIKYRGQQKDVRPFIKKAHAIIHPSKYGEGMSNVLLENASSGRPIITTDNPGCFETVDNGETGFIYQKGNVNELVKRIEQFIKLSHKEKEQMGLKGREKMKKEFDRRMVIDAYMDTVCNNNCLFVHDFRGYVIDDEVYTTNFSYDIISKRYLSIFDNVTFCNRIIINSTQNKNKLVKASGDRVSFLFDIPAFKSPLIFFNKKVKNIIKKNIDNNEYIIVRLDSFLGLIAIKYCIKKNKKYLVECAGCAWDSFWNHGVFGKIIAPFMFLKMRYAIMNADYVVYVTKDFLEKRYPTKGEYINCSNVDIKYDSENLEKRLLKIKTKKSNEKFVICTIGSMDVRYKGQQYVIKALSLLKKNGFSNFEYRIIGGGSNQYLQNVAKRYNVLDMVVFVGPLSHLDVLNELKCCDIYIQPSKQEGLPRSLIEAMSFGCFCLGTRIAGIPELLDDKYLFNKGFYMNVQIYKLLKSITIDKMIIAAKTNVEISSSYDSNYLELKRHDFFSKFKNGG